VRVQFVEQDRAEHHVAVLATLAALAVVMMRDMEEMTTAETAECLSLTEDRFA
jgi:hypothetical protein